jgi:hypothetical protein
MARLRRTFTLLHPFAKGAAVILLLMGSAPHDVAASPISILDRSGNGSAGVAKSARPIDIPDQVRRTPAPLIVVPNSVPSAADQPDMIADLSLAHAGLATPGSAPPGWLGNVTRDAPSGGGTLGGVLRSIITWHAADETPAAARRSARVRSDPLSGEGDDSDLGVDLRKLILDSEVGGAMLRSIVDIKTADKSGATFSIFGLGNFALDFAPDLHSAIVSELSSGLAFRMSLNGDRLGYDGYPSAALGNNPAAVPHDNVNLVRVVWNWILDFLYSPVGALLSMSLAITVLVWICVKSVVFLQRRASRF